MKRFILLVSLLLIVQVLFAGFASASYNPQNDKSINLYLPINVPIKGTASLTFNLQQAAQKTVSNTTGLSVDYFYIWVNVNGQPIAAVDPAKFMF
jgi:hypothetical protein